MKVNQATIIAGGRGTGIVLGTPPHSLRSFAPAFSSLIPCAQIH